MLSTRESENIKTLNTQQQQSRRRKNGLFIEVSIYISLSYLKVLPDAVDNQNLISICFSYEYRSKNLGAPYRRIEPVDVRHCPEECDDTIREAKFAFRTSDLASWTSVITSDGSVAGRDDGSTATNSTVFKRLQHWSLVVHFPRGDKTYLFEAGQDKDTGLLQATRTENVDFEVFNNANNYTSFGTLETSPRQLLDKAKQLYSYYQMPYNLTTNNCQTWLEEFLKLISPHLFNSFQEMSHRHTERAAAAAIATMVAVAALIVGVALIV